MIGQEANPTRDICGVSTLAIEAKLSHQKRRAEFRDKFLRTVGFVTKRFAEGPMQTGFMPRKVRFMPISA